MREAADPATPYVPIYEIAEVVETSPADSTS
jgi:hypothetical protein